MIYSVSPVTAWTAAVTSASSSFSISDAISLFVLVAVIALVVVVVLGMRPRRSQGTVSAHTAEIKRAAAADVAAVEEDNKFVRSDAPGRDEDEL